MHACTSHLVKLYCVYKAPLQVVTSQPETASQVVRDSFTVLAGRPQSLAVTIIPNIREMRIASASLPVPPPHACKERVQLRQLSATRSHTRTWPDYVHVSKVICHALAVADVTRRPSGLFPALTLVSCICVPHTLPSHLTCVYHLHATHSHTPRVCARTHNSPHLFNLRQKHESTAHTMRTLIRLTNL